MSQDKEAKSSYPMISCVVIGINCEKTITFCLVSIKESAYPNLAEIIYVDGGSKDKSVELARNLGEVKIIELHTTHPTPGKGRNAGWRAANGEWIQFFDGDTIARRGWLQEAIVHINEHTAAIFGQAKELYPDKNRFHYIADLEWRILDRGGRFFGGNVLIRRSVLEQTGGYDENLIAGEDPELSVRVRAKGWKILEINSLMCQHNINMTTVKQYFRRAFRSGYAYAEAGQIMLMNGEKTWFLKMIKLVAKTSLILFLAILVPFLKYPAIGIALVLIAAFSQLFKTRIFMKRFNISLKQALIYAIHCSIAKWPQFFGISKYFLNRLRSH